MKNIFTMVFWTKVFTIIIAIFSAIKVSFFWINLAYNHRGYQAIGGEALLAIGSMLIIYYFVEKFFSWLNEKYLE